MEENPSLAYCFDCARDYLSVESVMAGIDKELLAVSARQQHQSFRATGDHLTKIVHYPMFLFTPSIEQFSKPKVTLAHFHKS